MKLVFWLFSGWLMLSLLWRIYLWRTENYGYMSWAIEWVLSALALIGVYAVAYDQKIFNQTLWLVVLLLCLASSVYRLFSSRLKLQLAMISTKQKVLVYILMLLFTLPLYWGLWLNAANQTGLWS